VNGSPFETIESALEFLLLFDAAIAEARQDVCRELDVAADARQSEALRLALYKLEKLQYHIGRSRRMANDLRTLRRLVCEERATVHTVASAATGQIATSADSTLRDVSSSVSGAS
jgi:hypothetical protein